jgi:hypothetical protein
MADEQLDEDFEDWCRDRKLSSNSSTTRQLYENRYLTVQEYIGKFRRGSINAVLPEEARVMSVEEAVKMGKVGSVNIRKLLTDNRDKFQKR